MQFSTMTIDLPVERLNLETRNFFPSRFLALLALNLCILNECLTICLYRGAAEVLDWRSLIGSIEMKHFLNKYFGETL